MSVACTRHSIRRRHRRLVRPDQVVEIHQNSCQRIAAIVRTAERQSRTPTTVDYLLSTQGQATSIIVPVRLQILLLSQHAARPFHYSVSPAANAE
jgi:hypothetical protein